MTGPLTPDGLRILERALLNGASLAGHFIGRRDQRAIEAILADAYEED